MMTQMSRRRFLTICASAGAAAMLPGVATAGRRAPLHHWRGIMMGAETSVQLAHPDAREAKRLTQRCREEMLRLESLFSLYEPDSCVSQLNREGVLQAPPEELVEVLRLAQEVSRKTQGAFDITVQPLWQAHREHYAVDPARKDALPEAALQEVLTKVDYRAVEITDARISLVRPGMGITLNGIAQGYVTDRVTALLKAEGMTQVLVQMGENRALGTHPGGRPWQVGVRDPSHSGKMAYTLPLADRALATSGGYGTPFSADGRWHHLLDPRTGKSVNYYRSLSVLAPTAVLADALSTAGYVLPPDQLAALPHRFPGVEINGIDAGGGRFQLST